MLINRLHWRPILRASWWQVLLFCVFGALAVFSHEVHTTPAKYGVVGDFFTAIYVHTDIFLPELPFGVIGALGSALAIFLAFRNNSAYDRWWEARKLWGAVVNDSRSLARSVLTLLTLDGAHSVSPEQLKALQRRLVLGQVAWVHALRMHLRGQIATDLHTLRGLIPDDELEGLKDRTNVPNLILLRQGELVRDAWKLGLIDSYHHTHLDDIFSRLLNHQGGCERIKNTPVPRQYDEFPRLFTWVYAVLFPFGMASTTGWMTVPIGAVVCFFFLMLEGSGRVIEDPFDNKPQDTPMTALSTTIERNLREMLGDHDLPPPTSAPNDILM